VGARSGRRKGKVFTLNSQGLENNTEGTKKDAKAEHRQIKERGGIARPKKTTDSTSNPGRWRGRRRP